LVRFAYPREPRGAGVSPATIRSPFVLVHIGASTAFVCQADELSRSRLSQGSASSPQVSLMTGGPDKRKPSVVTPANS